jgi:hypothetical protein
MTKRQKTFQRIRNHNKDIRLEEIDHLLRDLGFEVKSTKHTSLYSKQPGHRIAFRRHPNKALPLDAIKILDKLLDDLGCYDNEM